MASLREKKKEDRKLRLQNAAIELFGSIGFEATTISKIAEKSVLGVGTFYNYFKSKDEVLLSIISDRSDQFGIKFDNAINNCTDNVLDSINLMIDLYFNSFSIYNKLIWREFISNIFGKQHNMISSIMSIDSLFINKLEQLLINLKVNGTLNGDINEASISNTIYSILIFQLLLYVLDDNMTENTAKDNISNQLKIIIKGLN